MRKRPARLLRLLIKGSGLTQVQIAAQAGITEKHLSRLCSGVTGISEETADAVANALGLPEEVLYVGMYLESLERERTVLDG
jgi:transcriptional regulator with XRE-family HTH domain